MTYDIYKVNGQTIVVPAGSAPPTGAELVAQGVSTADVIAAGLGPQIAMSHSIPQSTGPTNPGAVSPPTQPTGDYVNTAPPVSDALSDASNYSTDIQTGGLDPWLTENVRKGFMPESQTRNPNTPNGMLARDFYKEINNAGRSGKLGTNGMTNGPGSGTDWAQYAGWTDPQGLDGGTPGVPMGGSGGVSWSENDLPMWMLENPEQRGQAWWDQQGFAGDTGMNSMISMGANYEPLAEIMGGSGLTPDQAASGQGDFMQSMRNGTGGSSYVNTGAVWDQMFGGAYGGFANTNAGGADAPAQFGMVIDGITAMAPWLGETNQRVMTNRVNQAFRDYNSSGVANQGVGFIDWLRAQGAADWF
jgi:hypothetical protein